MIDRGRVLEVHCADGWNTRDTRYTRIDEMVDITMRWLSIGVGKGWQLGGLVTKMVGMGSRGTAW